jgi:hypothetical protein
MTMDEAEPGRLTIRTERRGVRRYTRGVRGCQGARHPALAPAAVGRYLAAADVPRLLQRRTNAARAGLPANHVIVNPDLQGGADLTTNSGSTNYHSLQLELRRRFSQGLQFQTSYVFGQAMQSVFTSFRRPQIMHDISVAKRVNLVGRTNFEFRLEMLNALNQHNFAPVGGLGNDISDDEVTGLTGTNTARVIQLVTRINW